MKKVTKKIEMEHFFLLLSLPHRRYNSASPKANGTGINMQNGQQNKIEIKEAISSVSKTPSTNLKASF